MSIRLPVNRLRGSALVTGFIVTLLSHHAAPQTIVTPDNATTRPAPASTSKYETLIARVRVNTVSKGDVALLRDALGKVLVPAAEFDSWGLSAGATAAVTVNGERYVPLSDMQDVEVRFDPRTVTLDIQVAAKALPTTIMNLGPQHRGNVTYPSDNSFFLNYGLNANGDDRFGQRRYQFATELGVRMGGWLLYNTTNDQWGNGMPSQFTRLMTNLQYDDRTNLRRLTLGDFFTPTFDLSSSVPLAGVSLTKFYSMDPYFIQYPTAAFQTEIAFPSTVQVRVDGNLIAQRQVQPGPVDITNITGVTGGQNVSVTIRDPFGREQVLQRPFFFATNAGLAESLHEYSYNLGSLRRQFGVESNDYGPLAASAFHRYAFTNELTLGLRGQATRSVYNIGPFGTYQLARFGIFGGGVSVGGREGRSGPAASLAYSYTGGNFSMNVGAQYLSKDFAQLSDFESENRTRTNQYVSGSLYFPALGTLGATYTALTTYNGPQTKVANLNYTRGVLDGKALLALNYIRTQEPQSSNTWLLSLRYFFDSNNSIVGAVGGGQGLNTQAISFERTIPEGEGLGYTFTAGHVGGDGSDGAYGRAFVQANAAHGIVSAEYSRASSPQAGPGLSQVSVAGSIGAVSGSFFAARPVDDSFALVRVPELREVPVYANGWYVGKTNAAGEVVATNIASYYDNFIAFGTGDLPLEYVFPSSEIVISPNNRSGTLVTFAIRKNRAFYGVLVELRDGVRVPLEFREISLKRDAAVISAFTARRGEFYVEGVDAGDYLLQLDGKPSCTATLTFKDQGEAMTDVGTVICTTGAR